MKIGILTFTYGDNYGQRLQNYAMQKILENKGHSVYTIKQNKPKISIKRKIKTSLKKVIYFKTAQKVNQRAKSFELFDKTYIKYFPIILHGNQDAKLINESFDMFIAGSDQVWSPFSSDVNENFFLTFADKEKRVAYAPSLAAEYIPENKKESYIHWIKGLSYLSVREEKGAELIKDLTGRAAEVVLDPTLLLSKEEWLDIIQQPNKIINEKYILALYLGEEYQKQCEQISKQLNMKLVIINPKISNESPSQLLYLIEHAKLVLTDSFHVTVFSIILHRPFITFDRQGNSINMSSRFQTLFNKLGIKNRFWSEIESTPNEWLKMDYEFIDAKLNEEKVKSNQFLDHALESRINL